MCNIKGKKNGWPCKVVDFKCGFFVERQHGCNMQCNRQTDGQTCVSSAAGERVNSSAVKQLKVYSRVGGLFRKPRWGFVVWRRMD